MQVCFSITQALRTIPPAALEVILNLPPLYIFVQGLARSYTEYTQVHHINTVHGLDYCERHKNCTLPNNAIRQDAPRHSYHKTYKISIYPLGKPIRNIPLIQAEFACYREDPKTNKRAGEVSTEPIKRLESQ